MIPTKEEIIQNPQFQPSGTLLVIFSFYRNMDFCDTM